MRVINKLPIVALFVLPILYAGYVPAASTWHEAKTHVAAKFSSPDEMVWKMCESPDAKKVDGCVVELYQGKTVAGCYRAHKAGQFGYVFCRNLCDQFKEKYKASRKVVCTSEGVPLETSALKQEYESVKDKHCRVTCGGDSSYTIDFAADSATICDAQCTDRCNGQRAGCEYRGQALGSLTDEEIESQIQRALERGKTESNKNANREADPTSDPIRKKRTTEFSGTVSITGSRTTTKPIELVERRHQDFTVYLLANEFAGHRAQDLAVTNQALWVGTSNGLLRYDLAEDNWTWVDSDDATNGAGVSTLAADGNWVAASFETYPKPGHVNTAGTYLYNRSSNSWKEILPSKHYWDAHWDGADVWFAASRRLYRMSPMSSRQEVYTERDPFFANNTIRRVKGHRGEIWLATLGKHDRSRKEWFGGGVARLDVPLERWSYYTTKDGLAYGYCADIAVDAEEVWVAHWHKEKGLSLYDRKKNQWRTIRKSTNGLDVGGVSLALDKEYLWIGQQRGLVRLSRDTHEAILYTEKDGLPGYIVNDIVVGEDAVWVSAYAYGGTGFHDIRSSGVVRIPRK